MEVTEAKFSPPHKRPLLDRIADPAPELILGKKEPSVILSRRILLWQKQAHAGQLSNIYPEEIEVATSSELLILASIYAETGLSTRAAALVQLAVERDAQILDCERYLGLIEAVSNYLPSVRERYASEVELARLCRRASGRFEKIIRDNKGSIAIVGNSPICRGSGKGEGIDERVVVIRFNNYSTAPEFRSDYGGKTNIWFRTRDYTWLYRRDETRFDHVVCGGPSFFYRCLNAHELLFDSSVLDIIPEQIPPEIFRDLRSRHGILAPSTGLLALYWVYFILGSLDGVLIAGFEMTDQGVGETVHYFEQGHKQQATPHDWAKERLVLDFLTAGANCSS